MVAASLSNTLSNGDMSAKIGITSAAIQAINGGKEMIFLMIDRDEGLLLPEAFIANNIPAVARIIKVTWSQITAVLNSCSPKYAIVSGKPTKEVLLKPVDNLSAAAVCLLNAFRLAYIFTYNHAQSQITTGISTGSSSELFHSICGRYLKETAGNAILMIQAFTPLWASFGSEAYLLNKKPTSMHKPVKKKLVMQVVLYR